VRVQRQEKKRSCYQYRTEAQRDECNKKTTKATNKNLTGKSKVTDQNLERSTVYVE
jgi:hypothetical protein